MKSFERNGIKWTVWEPMPYPPVTEEDKFKWAMFLALLDKYKQPKEINNE